MNCFSCSHHVVCIHFIKYRENFPYKNDQKINEFMEGIATVMAKSCFYYDCKNPTEE